MAYTPDPTDFLEPLDTEKAKTAAAEFRALKAYIANDVAKVAGDTYTGNMNFTVDAARIGYLAASDAGMFDGANTANYGLTVGAEYTSMAPTRGVALKGYGGIHLLTGFGVTTIDANGSVVTNAAAISQERASQTLTSMKVSVAGADLKKSFTSHDGAGELRWGGVNDAETIWTRYFKIQTDGKASYNGGSFDAAFGKSFIHYQGWANPGFSSTSAVDIAAASSIIANRVMASRVAPATGFMRISVSEVVANNTSGVTGTLQWYPRRGASTLNPSHSLTLGPSGSDTATDYASMDVIVPCTAGDTMSISAQVSAGMTVDLYMQGITFEMFSAT